MPDSGRGTVKGEGSSRVSVGIDEEEVGGSEGEEGSAAGEETAGSSVNGLTSSGSDIVR
jgi:hypothetical protein